MTIAELIEALKQHDPNMRVLVKGFDESGYDDPGLPLETVEVVQTSTEAAHFGMYEETQDVRPHHTRYGEPFRAIVIDF